MAVNLNYTLSSEVMNDCLAQCGIRHVLTSRRVMERFDLKLRAEVVCLEDTLGQITWADKFCAAAAAWLAPLGWLERRLGLTKIRDDDLLTVIFTSGSTGRPKGVMLTHRNVGANIEAVNQIVRLADDDVLLGILPLFHSFGYTVTMWTVLSLAPKGIYHFNPLEAREVGKLCRKHGATIMVTTPTFVRSYLRRCEPEDFAALDVVFAGAEKLTSELADAFEKRFGVRPVEGYGAHGAVAGGGRQHSAQPRRQRGSRRRQRRHRRPAAARRPGQSRRSGNRRRAGAQPVGHAAGFRAWRDERLLRPARTDRGSPSRRMVRHRRRGDNRRRGVHQHHRPHQPLLQAGRRDGAARPRGRGHPPRSSDSTKTN